MIVDEVRSHYEQRWGSPSREAECSVQGEPMEVLKWAADNNPEGVALYATVGASVRETDSDHPAHRNEFYVGLLPEVDDVARPLAMLATYSARTGKTVSHGDTVSFEEPLWSSTEMRGFLVTQAKEGFLDALPADGGVHVEFLQSIPLYESEVALKHQLGASGLLERWWTKRVPFWDPTREPVDS